MGIRRFFQEAGLLPAVLMRALQHGKRLHDEDVYPKMLVFGRSRMA
jgi:hypothetical protein